MSTVGLEGRKEEIEIIAAVVVVAAAAIGALRALLPHATCRRRCRKNSGRGWH